VASVEPLDSRDIEMARRLHRLLALAHAQEAMLLQHTQRLAATVADIQASGDFHLGAWSEGELLGALSIAPDDEPGQLCIRQLVVHPLHQRQGLARALVAEALRRGPGMVFAVAAGADNAPALALYRSLGFATYRRGSLGPQALPLLKLRRAPTTLAPGATP
jgi:ribosomal protein S18 acetylase RimI-like enzyme